MEERRYVPALGYRWLTGIYDPVVGLTTRESTFKAELLRQAAIAPGESVLDLACGTGTLAIMARQRQPSASITGIDGDPEILAIARDKARHAGAEVRFDQGLSFKMPYGDGSHDCVLSSLFFHHLSRDDKLATLREVRRVLKPGGRLHVADWGKAQNALMRLAFFGIQLLDGFPNTGDNVAGRLPGFIADCGFVDVRETAQFATVFGTMSLYAARAPQ